MAASDKELAATFDGILLGLHCWEACQLQLGDINNMSLSVNSSEQISNYNSQDQNACPQVVTVAPFSQDGALR